MDSAPLPAPRASALSLEQHGPWALVAGGSEGVGAHLSVKLARQGFNLVLLAVGGSPLDAVAGACRAEGVDVRALPVDLTSPDTALASTRRQTDDIEVGLFAYVAGANLKGCRGAFPDLPLDAVRRVVAMNVDGPLLFAHHYGGRMKQRGRGGIVLFGSKAGFAGTPQLAHYSGAKAFNRIFSEALWCDMAPFGVEVLHLSLDSTATPAMTRLGYDISTWDDPELVAQEALDHIADGPLWVAGGAANYTEALRRMTGMPRAALVAGITRSGPKK